MKPFTPSRDQQEALDAINASHNIFLTGCAGTGMSTVLHEMIKRLKSQKNVVVLSSDSFTANQLGGETLESFFELGNGVAEISDICMPSRQKKVLEVADVVVIDEISTVRSDVFELIYRKLQEFNIQLIVCGDFLQLAPEINDIHVNRYLQSNFGGIYAFQTQAWNDADFISIVLKTPFRHKRSKDVRHLNAIRIGEHEMINPLTRKTHIRELNEICLFRQLYDNPVCLCMTDHDAQDRNNDALRYIPVPESIIPGIIKGNYPQHDFPVEQYLRLKPGATVMLRADRYDSKKGSFDFLNGDICTVVKVHNGVNPSVDVELDSGTITSIGPTVWTNTKYDTEVDVDGNEKLTQRVDGEFSQVPLSLACAITIRQARGMTFQEVYLSLGPGGYLYPGELYTALSRAPSLFNVSFGRAVYSRDIIADPDAVEFMRRIQIKADDKQSAKE